MNDGGALSVQKNDLHGATQCGLSVEAYAWTPTMHAACTWATPVDFDDFDNFTIHWRQYTDDRFEFRNPFTAVLSAWSLRWN